MWAAVAANNVMSSSAASLRDHMPITPQSTISEISPKKYRYPKGSIITQPRNMKKKSYKKLTLLSSRGPLLFIGISYPLISIVELRFDILATKNRWCLSCKQQWILITWMWICMNLNEFEWACCSAGGITLRRRKNLNCEQFIQPWGTVLLFLCQIFFEYCTNS